MTVADRSAGATGPALRLDTELTSSRQVASQRAMGRNSMCLERISLTVPPFGGGRESPVHGMVV
jgi:hypothetical protein